MQCCKLEFIQKERITKEVRTGILTRCKKIDWNTQQGNFWITQRETLK
jgi:hypothetical protein